ncbi:general substrate transporter [Fistulina hepatica ATCC 64428]|uniref:General substrate transporter n=1 Tax=Fistulina hepatica ATCC 64428 TaxID=1128425 RepID=A0A0D7AFK7_9AGAR|nr:general substrate transporter [Fistulina hepatica ATCC 64428]
MDVYRANVTPQLLLVAFASSLGAITYGFDNTWWSGVIGETSFNQAYGDIVAADGTKTLSTVQVSIGTGLGTTGVMIGCMVAAPISNFLGRRLGMLVLGLISASGCLIEATSNTGMHGRYAQIIVGRVICSIAIGMASNVVPVYLSESAPKAIRGGLVAFYVVTQNVAAFLATVVIYKVQFYPHQAAWLVPICVQFLTPLLIITTIGFIPESPRWLVAKGRSNDAHTVLMRLRRPDVDIDGELLELTAAVAEQLERDKHSNFLHLFRGTNLRRTLIAIGVQCLANAQGIGYIVSYMIVLFEQLGIQDSYLILVIGYGVYAAFACLSFVLPDRIGRRNLLFIGGAICAACMLAIGGITTKWPTPPGAAGRAVVALTLVWFCANACTWSPVSWLIPAEIGSAKMRESTMMSASWSGFGVTLIINYVSPYIQDSGYGNLGGKIGYIWGSFSVIAVFFAFFFVTETRGRSLEELDALFEAHVPTFRFERTRIEDLDNTVLAHLDQVRERKGDEAASAGSSDEKTPV